MAILAKCDQNRIRIQIWQTWLINPLKDARGIRKFIKETLHASAGKTTHGLIGSAEIPLRNVKDWSLSDSSWIIDSGRILPELIQ